VLSSIPSSEATREVHGTFMSSAIGRRPKYPEEPHRNNIGPAPSAASAAGRLPKLSCVLTLPSPNSVVHPSLPSASLVPSTTIRCCILS